MTWRPGTPALSFDSGKHKRCPTGHRHQEASEDFFAGLELRSGYALPPFQAGNPRLTLIDAGVSSCLSRRTEWRTPPLWGIGLTETVSGHTLFLHDGRARNLLEAILWHGGEAEASKERVVAMTRDERAALLAFLRSL